MKPSNGGGGDRGSELILVQIRIRRETYEWFRKNPEVGMSRIVRDLLSKFVENHPGGIGGRDQ